MRLSGEGLACVRGGREVFSQLTFSVGAGEVLLLRGPNGAGKSSLLRLIAGLVRRSAGELSLEGGEPDVPVSEQAHYIGHLDALKPAMTAYENLSFWADMLGQPERPVAEALNAVGLGGLADFPAGILSAGQRRRLSIARLVASRRPVWLLDEPTTAIDTQSRERLYGLIGNHLKGGGIALIATHDEIPLQARTLTLGAAA